MPVLERRISLRGPRFWIEGDELMFCNQIDGSTRDGPRLATNTDAEAHPEAFAASEAEQNQADPPGKPLVTAVDPAVKPPPPPRPHAEKRNATLA